MRRNKCWYRVFLLARVSSVRPNDSNKKLNKNDLALVVQRAFSKKTKTHNVSVHLKGVCVYVYRSFSSLLYNNILTVVDGALCGSLWLREDLIWIFRKFQAKPPLFTLWFIAAFGSGVINVFFGGEGKLKTRKTRLDYYIGKTFLFFSLILFLSVRYRGMNVKRLIPHPHIHAHTQKNLYVYIYIYIDLTYNISVHSFFSVEGRVFYIILPSVVFFLLFVRHIRCTLYSF